MTIHASNTYNKKFATYTVKTIFKNDELSHYEVDVETDIRNFNIKTHRFSVGDFVKIESFISETEKKLCVISILEEHTFYGTNLIDGRKFESIASEIICKNDAS